jgi:hypothetical protein
VVDNQVDRYLSKRCQIEELLSSQVKHLHLSNLDQSFCGFLNGHQKLLKYFGLGIKLDTLHLLASIFLQFKTLFHPITSLSPPLGTIMSACVLVGAMKTSNDGLTNCPYCSMTLLRLRPRCVMSRFKRRPNLKRVSPINICFIVL